MLSKADLTSHSAVNNIIHIFDILASLISCPELDFVSKRRASGEEGKADHSGKMRTRAFLQSPQRREKTGQFTLRRSERVRERQELCSRLRQSQPCLVWGLIWVRHPLGTKTQPSAQSPTGAGNWGQK